MDTLTLSCGHPPTPTTGIGTGWARTRDDRTLCYACAADETREELRSADYGHRVTLYVSSDGASITTWDGQIMGRVLQWGSRHPRSRERQYLTAMIEGRMWSGTGAPGMYASLRRVRAS